MSMLTELGLGDRLVNDYSEIYNILELLTAIDYERVQKTLEPLRKRSYGWLYNAIKAPKDKLPGVRLSDTVETVTKENKCTGCGACAQICPSHAITMMKNKGGFLTPVVDNLKCTQCGICYYRCPSFHSSFL